MGPQFSGIWLPSNRRELLCSLAMAFGAAILVAILEITLAKM